jgi:hypothetical protein
MSSVLALRRTTSRALDLARLLPPETAGETECCSEKLAAFVSHLFTLISGSGHVVRTGINDHAQASGRLRVAAGGTAAGRPLRATRAVDAYRALEYSLYDLIRLHQQQWRDREAECLRSPHVDHELELGRLLHRKVRRLGALQDLVHVDRSTPLHLGNIYSIGHEPTWLYKHAELIDSGDPMRGRQIEDDPSMHEHKSWGHHYYTLVVIPFHAEESGGQILRSAHDERMNLYAEAPSRDSDLFTVLSGYVGEHRGCDILSKKRDL